jgi:prephenate dehydratase
VHRFCFASKTIFYRMDRKKRSPKSILTPKCSASAGNGSKRMRPKRNGLKSRAPPKQQNELLKAALAGALAAEVYGLEILERSIQDSPNNTTRFLVISHATCPPTGTDKTSLMFCVQDRVGALYSAIEPFNRLKLSMSKIESRPSKRKNWEYFFFVDIEGHCDDEQVKSAILELEKHCTFVKVLGSYPRTDAAGG